MFHMIFLILNVLGLSAVLSGQPGYARAEPLDQKSLDIKIQLAAHYLARSERPDGLFPYQYDFLQDRFVKKDHDVRQAGAGYALAEYYNHTGDPLVEKRLARLLKSYRKMSAPYKGGWLFRGQRQPKKAQTGATALALLAELLYREKSGDQQFSGISRKWLDGLLALRKAEGGIRMSPGTEAESGYFDGETWLAFAHYARLHPGDRRLGDVLGALDDYWIRKYQYSGFNISFYHWGAMASAVRHQTTGRRVFLEFMESQAYTFLSERPFVLTKYNACFSVEGLADYALVLKSRRDHDAGHLSDVIKRIHAEVANSIELQLRPGQDRIYFGDNRYLHSASLPSFTGAFLDKRYHPSTRIDTTQHCLSALVKYRALRSP